MGRKQERGFLYIAFGASFRKEAVLSARSLRRFCRSPIALFSDAMPEADDLQMLDEVRLIRPDHRRAKVDFIAETPFRKTVYLDSDTLIVRDVEDMFDVLDRFDVGVVHDYARKRNNFAAQISEYGEIPYSFSEVNGGVMSFNDSARTRKFLKLWRRYFYKYREQTSGWDQVSLRIALWRADVRIHHYPFEYNIRSQANREKQDRFKREFGEQHLAPRIYHMHYDPEVHRGVFRPRSVGELEELIPPAAVKY